MLRQITAKQFMEWMAYDQLEPFGQERLEQTVSQITQVLMNVHRAKGKDPLKLYHVTPLFGDDVVPASAVPKKDWRVMEAEFMAMAADSKKTKKKPTSTTPPVPHTRSPIRKGKKA
jgi:hypothetical protein